MTAIKEKVFAGFTNLQGKRIDVIECTVRSIIHANNKFEIYPDKEQYYPGLFLQAELILIDDQHISFEEYLSLSVDDYVQLTEIFKLQLTKLEL